MTYRPRADSLAARVCAWFQRNPEEALSIADICTKFDVPTASNVTAQLKPAVEADYLTSTKTSAGLIEYREGPNLASLPSATSAAAAPRSNRALAWPGSGPATAPQMPPANALVIEPGVPLPPPRQRSNAYVAVFMRMEKGDSVLLDTPVAKRLISTAQTYGKTCDRKFITRQVDDSQSRIWRTE